jgi:hypothetical protein
MRPSVLPVLEVIAKPLSAAGSMIERAMKAAGLLG